MANSKTLKSVILDHTSLSAKEAARVASLVVSSLALELKGRRGSSISIPGFGSFKVIKKKSRSYRHPKDGSLRVAGPKTTVKFSPSSSLFPKS